MEGFRNFTSAMDRASDFCSMWKCTDEDGTIFSYAELMLVAAHLDMNYPLGERQWYVVFPDGEICMLHEDFEEIMSLYKPIKSKPIQQKLTGDEFYPDSPGEEKQQTKDYKFCPYCGGKLHSDAVFCAHCGKKVA